MSNIPTEFILGDWNIRCDRCGRELKASKSLLTWQGYRVCPEHWEPRQPQDFVRGIVERPTPAFVRNPPDLSLSTPVGILNEADDTAVDPWHEFIFVYDENGTYIITEG